MLRNGLAAVLVVGVGAVTADDRGSPKPPAEGVPKPDFVTAFQAAKKEFDAKLPKLATDFGNEHAAAKTEDEREAVLARGRRELARFLAPIAERVMATVRPHAADPAALDALVWVAARGNWTPPAAEAAELLTKYHLTLKETIALAERQQNAPQRWTEPMLRAQLAAADLPAADRPRVLRSLAELKKTLSEMPAALDRLAGDELEMAEGRFGKRLLAEFRAINVAEAEAEAVRLFTELGEKHGSEKTARGVTCGELAESALYEMRNLSVGKTAPEIEGEDTDGVAFKLSEYRGKVVLLTFWGTWCGPCMAMVPHERDIAARLKDKPFAIVGVNSDADKTKLKQVAEKERITWRSFWCGEKGPGGAVPAAWNVAGWPTVYVLDRKGVIRAKQKHGKALDRVLDALVSEVDANP